MPRGNRMTPSYAVKNGTRYRYYVSSQDQRESATALRIPAGEIEHLVTSRVRQWLLDPGGIYQSTRLPDLSAQRRLIACAVEIGKSWTELPGTRRKPMRPFRLRRAATCCISQEAIGKSVVFLRRRRNPARQ